MNRPIIILLLLISLCCCTKDEENTYLKLSVKELFFDNIGGMKYVEVESNVEWYISSELPAWLSVTNTKKTDGNGVIYVTALDNTTDNTRSYNLILIASDQEKTVRVLQKAKGKLLFVGEKKHTVDASFSRLTINVDSNIDYQLTISEKWIRKISKERVRDIESSSDKHKKGNKIDLEIDENPDNEERLAEVIIYNSIYNLSDTVYVVQEAGGNYYSDGNYIQLQKASQGKATLILMGDGFTKKDLTMYGHYEAVMRQVADYFFSIEPYESYRNYFNVYMVVAESDEEGVSEGGFSKKVRNKFETAFGSGTEITCNADLVFEYARKVENFSEGSPVTVIVALNSTKYAGTTYLYANGHSIALCPMSDKESPNDFEGLIHHEAGGHAFGFLCDEYIYYDRQLPDNERKNIEYWQKLGFQMNLDFTNDLNNILWKDFVEHYATVGAYEGGAKYRYGVWRSEENSCMNNNIPYFNVQSRWSIVSRIMKLSGKEFDVADFMKADNPVYPSEENITRAISTFVPLGQPIWNK